MNYSIKIYLNEKKISHLYLQRKYIISYFYVLSIDFEKKFFLEE
jgi:hypothetical protein